MPEAEGPDYGDLVEWYTPATIRETDSETGTAPWAEAADIPLPLLTDLLFIARSSIEAYAPALPEDTPAGACPVTYRHAQLMQTRNLWNATEVDAGGGFGGDDYTIRPMPLDWIIKQIVRPKTAIPVAL
jgi:hypothetical protein